MSPNVETFSSAFGALLNAAKTMDYSGGCIALPLHGERAGVREDHLSSTTMKRCATHPRSHLEFSGITAASAVVRRAPAPNTNAQESTKQ